MLESYQWDLLNLHGAGRRVHSKVCGQKISHFSHYTCIQGYDS
jgi:hypothetical protein